MEPFAGVGLIVSVAPPPAAALTVSVTDAEWLKDPLEPVIVNVKAPVCAVPVVLTVRVEVPDPLMLAGLKLPLAPEPKPAADKDTAPEKPFSAETDTVYVVLLPCTTVDD